MFPIQFHWYLFAALLVGTLPVGAQNATELPLAPAVAPAPLVLPKQAGPIPLYSSKPSDIPPPSPAPTEEESWCSNIKDIGVRSNQPFTPTVDRAAVLYRRTMESKIYANWKIPWEATGSWAKAGSLLIRFQIQRDGSITDPALMLSSGSRVYDQRALASVQKSAPFSRVPELLELPLRVCMRFSYNEDLHPQAPLPDPFAPKPKPARP